MNDELKKYIKNERNLGASDEEIRNTLKEQGGWENNDLDAVFNVAAEVSQTQESPQTKTEDYKVTPATEYSENQYKSVADHNALGDSSIQDFSNGKQKTIVEENYVKKFSWVAFLGTWVYLFLNKQYKLGWKFLILFLILIFLEYAPWLGIVGFIEADKYSSTLGLIFFGFAVWLGIKGREKIWESGVWQSIEEFKNRQRSIKILVTIYLITLVILGIVLLGIIVSPYVENPEKLDEIVKQELFSEALSRNANLNVSEFNSGYQVGITDETTGKYDATINEIQTESYSTGYISGYIASCLKKGNDPLFCTKEALGISDTTTVVSSHGFSFTPPEGWILWEGVSALRDSGHEDWPSSKTDPDYVDLVSLQAFISNWEPKSSRELTYTDSDVDVKTRDLNTIINHTNELINNQLLYNRVSISFVERPVDLTKGEIFNEQRERKYISFLGQNSEYFRFKAFSNDYDLVTISFPLSESTSLTFFRHVKKSDDQVVDFLEKFVAGLIIK